jgi:hypothetical protein
MPSARFVMRFSTPSTMLFTVVMVTLACTSCKKSDRDAGSSRTAAPPGADSGGKVFRDVTSARGIDFVHEPGATGAYRFPEIMAGGVALFDMNGDGLLDVYFTNGHRGLPDPEGDETARNVAYQQTAAGKFINVTKTSGLGDKGFGMGVAVGDVDNDGDLDVYVANYGPDRLYANDGTGRFTDVTSGFGLPTASNGWSSSAGFLDFDRDGWLDLYVVRYVEVNELKECSDDLGRPDYCSPKAFYAVHDLLYRNVGGKFEDVSAAGGIAGTRSAGLGLTCGDFNDDGWMDVYVANDAYPNNLWLSKEGRTFRDGALLAGAALNMNGQAEAGMGVVAADFDNDDDLDLFMTHLRSESNTYYSNLGGSSGFSDKTGQLGLATCSLPWTGFGTAAFDLELDGDLDIAVVNGAVVRGEKAIGSHLAEPWVDYAEPNLMLINNGEAGFAAHEGAAVFSDHAAVSRGMAAGDLDNDGDVDLVISNLGDGARVLLNESPRRGRWIGIRAVDPRYSRDAIGARISIDTPLGRLTRTVGGSSSYQSSGDLRVHFGLGQLERVDAIEVLWPDGLRETFSDFDSDRYVTLARGLGNMQP